MATQPTSTPAGPTASADQIRKNLEAAMAALGAKKAKPTIEHHRLWPFHAEVETMKTKMKATHEEIAEALTTAGLKASPSQVATFWTQWKGKARRRARATANT
jgi:hypothetical protein